MATLPPAFHAANTEFAYQLHYHVGFRTRRCRSLFAQPDRTAFLRTTLAEVARRCRIHVLEVETDDCWVRLLLSLRPEHAPATIVQTLKANTSRPFAESFPAGDQGAMWSRGYYLRGVGDVTNQTVRAYVANQRRHHEIDRSDSRLLASYQHPQYDQFFDFRSFDHCVAEYNCHLVCVPVRHVAAIDAIYAEPMLAYLRCVADRKQFEIISLAVLEDHIHLFAALRPRQSPSDLAFAVMNNSWQWLVRHNPGAMKLWNAPGFWTPSAFVRTAGAVTSNVVRAYLQDVE